MPRKARIDAPGALHHIMARGIEKRDIFCDDLDRDIPITEIIEEHDLEAPDVVLSGIPFSTMPQDLGIEILQGVHDALAPGGRFIAYGSVVDNITGDPTYIAAR